MCLKILIVGAFLSTHVFASTVVDRVEVIVNSTIITSSDISQYKNKLKSGGLVDDALLSLINPKELIKSKKKLVDHLINERLLDHEVQKQDLQVTIEAVEAEIRKIAGGNKISRSDLKKALRKKGVQFSDYQSYIKKTLERKKLITKEISSKIKISDEDIYAYYLANTKQPGTLFFEYKVSHIQFLKGNGGEDDALERAASVYEKLEKGESFSSLAAKYSEDPNFTQGGLLGTFKSGELNPSFDKALKGLGVGEYSKVISTPHSYHILAVTKKTLIPDPKMVAQKERIHGILYSGLFKKQFLTWLQEKRQDAYIFFN